jgi:hypothetical protein
MRSVARFTIVMVLTLLAGISSKAQFSQTCYFVRGPAAGQTQFFPSGTPAPIGSQCTDGIASLGFAVPNGTTNPKGVFTFTSLTKFTCTDILGRSVRYLPNNGIPKQGLSTVDPLGPVIYIKTAVVSTLPAPVVKYLDAHECGHHALGHVQASLALGPAAPIGRDEELAADCFSITRLRAQNGLDDPETTAVLNFLANIPPDAVNYPGPLRVQRIRACAQLPPGV